MAAAITFAVATAIVSAPVLAGAQPSAEPDVVATSAGGRPEQPPWPRGRRLLPDYDGRGQESASFGSRLLWVPRIVAFPLYITTEYVLRQPVGWLVRTAEKQQWPTAILNFFTFDKEHTAGLIPTAMIDFGFRPSVGAYLFIDRALHRNNSIRAYGATWGQDWLNLAVTDRVRLSSTTTFAVHASWSRRKDWVFHGMGARSLQDDRSRFSADIVDVGADFETVFSAWVRVRTGFGARNTGFRDSVCCDDPSLEQLVAAGRFDEPVGYREGYTIGYQNMQLVVDTRRPGSRALPNGATRRHSGLRLTLEAQPAFNLKGAGSSWVRYGGTLGAFADLTGHGRVLGLVVTALLADSIFNQHIPFTEQIVLGGKPFMRGFLQGRLVGRSAFMATVQYQWPVWVWLDGTLQVGVGNVFDERFSDLDPRLLRLSTGLGLRTNNSPDHQFEILAGFGSETFEQGGAINSFRFAVGTTRGF